jgi:galactose mutarotase-like enzyme
MVDSILSGGLKAGDSVEVSGGRSDFNNYSQVGMLSGAYRSRSYITKISSNNPLPAAQLVTVKQLLASPESFESELVRIVNLRTGATGNFAASTNYNVWDGTTTGDTTVLRVISAADTEIEDAPALAIPTGTFTFEGTLIQFCSSPASGCLTGYQLQGVRKSEIIAAPPVLTLGAFNLLSPPNNARVEVEEGSTALVNVTWNKSANAANYKWMATLPIGNFNTPLLTLASNNAGVDTVLTLGSGAVDALLASFGLKKGDSIALKWTVFSYKATSDSLQASQEFTITLVRKRKLQAFNLSTPANNSRLEVDQNETTPVVVTWNGSATGATYKWFLDLETGNFSNPWAVLSSDNSGAATQLSLTSGAIDALLNTKGVIDGDSVNLKWTVRAYETNDSLQATQTFNLKAVRKKAIGVLENDFLNTINLYPNPTLGNSTLSFELNQKENIQITLLDVQGRNVTTLPYMDFSSGKHEVEIPSSVLQSGIYFVQINAGEKTSLIKLVVAH